MIPLRLYLYAGAVAALMAGVLWLALHERAVGAEGVRAEQREAVAVAQRRSEQLAADLATEQARKKVVYATITKTVDRIVDRPVYRDHDCLDDDGLVLVNAAFAGRAASEPAAALPPAGAADGSDGR